MKNVIFLAPPAAGKGTLSKFLENNFGYTHISTGDLFREKIASQDDEGKELEKILENGNLIDDEHLFTYLKEKLQKINQNKNFVLDGVPRTLQQARILDIILRDLGFSDYIVILIHVDKEVLQKRMTGRRFCPKCKRTYNIYFEKFKPQNEQICDNCGSILEQRKDDNIATYQTRYEIFENNIKPVIDYYKEQKKLFEIDNTEEHHQKCLKELKRIVGVFC